MFNCCIFNKHQIFTDTPITYVINCNDDGYIIDIDDATLSLLMYEKQNLLTKFIGILMSPFMNYLHKNVLLPKYKNLNNIKKNIAHIFLSGKSAKRPLIIYNILKEPIYILLSVNFMKFGFNISFVVCDDIANKYIYSKKICSTNNSFGFKQTNNKLVIISIDFINSTEQLISNGVLNYININKRFHNDIITKIKRYYYPYIYLHEIIGDAFILLLNADWTFNIPRYTTSLALLFIYELIQITNEYIKIRCGVVYDNVHYGHIDNNLRLFGKAINTAARLESACESEYEINCDNNFVNTLFEEKIFKMTNLLITPKEGILKGLGMVKYNTINVHQKNMTEISEMVEIVEQPNNLIL